MTKKQSNPAPQTFGRKISILRDSRGLSREAVAKAVGLSSVYLWQLESDRHDNPGLKLVQSFCRFFGVPLSHFGDDA